MAALKLVDLPAEERILSVRHEINSRGNCYVAEDIRQTYLLVSQNLIRTMEAIEVLTNEQPCKTCLYSSASFVRGRHKSFNIVKSTKEQLPTLVEEHRGHYAKVVICSTNLAAWRLGQGPSHILSASNQEEVQDK